MDTVLFEQKMKQRLEKLFQADDYDVEAVEIIIPDALNHNIKIDLSQDSYYCLVSKELDIEVITALYISSEINFISTSKEDWEFDNEYRMEFFRNYIHIRTENATVGFQFKLKFLKVTPYRE